MLITRTSIYSGVTRTVDIPVTDEQLHLWQRGVPIQNVMPHLTASQREFLMSGMVDEEWDQMNADLEADLEELGDDDPWDYCHDDEMHEGEV